MIGRIAAAGFFLFAAAAPAIADTESEGLIRDFVAWVDSSDDWSASASVIRSEGGDTFAEGIVISRDEPRISISIEALRLSDLEARSGGGFTASEIELTAGAVLTDALETSIPSAALWNISMPSLADVAIDPRHLMTSISRFYSVAAEGALDELSIPEVSLTQRVQAPGTTAPTEMHAVYRDISLTELADGVLGHQELGPISVNTKTPGGEAFEFGIEKIEADRVDIGAFARILDATAYRDGRGDNIWRPLFSRVIYSNLSGNGTDGATFKLDEVAIENIDGRQPEKPFTEVWDRLIDPEVPQDAKDDLALEAMTTMFAAWRVGTIRLDGVSIDAPEDNGSFSLHGATVTAWSSAGVDSFILDNLRASSPEGFLSLRSVELAGFVSPDLKALMRFAALEKNLDIQRHAAAIKEAFAALPRLAHFGLHDVVAGKSETDAASLTDFTLDFRDWNTIYAGATDIRIEGLTIPRRLLDLDADTTAMLDTLGYDDLVLGISLSDRWDPNSGTDDATWAFSLKDAADVELSYSLTGITLDWLMRATAAAAASKDNHAALMAMVNDLRVARVTLSVTDRSLLDRAFAVAAEKQGLSVEGAAYREQMRAALPFIISAAVPAELAKLLTEPLQKFLAGGQMLFADAAPPTPLGVMDLMAAAADPMGLPNLLNLTLRSEAPAQ